MSTWTIARPSTIAIGILLTVASAFAFATAAFIASQLVAGATPGSVVAFFEAAFGVLFMLGIYGRGLRELPRTPARAWPWLILTGISLSAGFGGFYSALDHAELSVVAPIPGAVPLVSYAFVLLLLRGQERLTKRVVAGAVLVVAGVVLIGVTNT